MTRPDKAAAPIGDLIGRDFNAEAINQKWCGDLTEIPTDEGKLYLATVEDLASWRLPGFAMGSASRRGVGQSGAVYGRRSTRRGHSGRDLPHRQRRRVHRRHLRQDLSGVGGGPVDGEGRIGTGQRSCGKFQLHPRVGAAVAPALRHQSPGPPRGRRVHRPLQPPTPAQQLRDEAPRRLRTDPRRPSRSSRTEQHDNRDFTASSKLSKATRQNQDTRQ